MQEFTKEVTKALTERLSGAFYGSFIISWLIYNWEFVYSALFLSEDKIWSVYHVLKNEYLRIMFFPTNGFIELFHNVSKNLILPLLSAYIAVWILPKFLIIPAFKRTEKYETIKHKFRAAELKERSQENVQLSQIQAKEIKARKELAEEQKELDIVDKTIVWDSEFDKFQLSNLYSNIKFLIESIYQKSGKIRDYDYDGRMTFQIPIDFLSYADSNELVTLIEKNGEDLIQLTEKGKYFIKRYQENSINLKS